MPPVLLHQPFRNGPTEDLKKVDVPTLILHGDDDRSCRAPTRPCVGKLVRAPAEVYKAARTGSADREEPGQRGSARFIKS